MTDKSEAGQTASAVSQKTGIPTECLSDAAPDVRQAVDSVLRASDRPEIQWRYTERIEAAWRQDPLSELIETVHRELEVGLRAGAMPARDPMPVNLELGLSRSESEAVQYQRRMERAGTCVFGGGTLAETALDRELVWKAIAQRGVPRRGWLEISLPVERHWVEGVAEVLDQWLGDGRVKPEDIAPLRDAARRRLSGERWEDEIQTVSCRVWTGDRTEHDRMFADIAEVFGADRSMVEEMRELRERLPRDVVVQRWVEFQLAPELSDAQAEEIVVAWCRKSLAGVGWHACIHAPAWRDGQGHYQVYVFFAQVGVAYWRDGEGILRNELTIDQRGRVKMLEIPRQLWAAGRGGRWRRDALIQSWEETLADELNQALERADLPRRYDTRAGRGQESGGGTHGSNAPCTWQGIRDALLTRSRAARRREGSKTEQDQRVRSALDAMRLLTGIGDDSPEGFRLWDQLERALSRDETHTADDTDVVTFLHALARGYGRAAPVAEWLTDWLVALVDETEGARLGKLAAGFVGQWDAHTRAILELDTRPNTRTLMAQARRWERETAPWRERLRRLCATECTERGHDTELRALADDIEERGLTLADVADEQQLQWIERRERWLTGAIWATDAQTRLGQCTYVDTVDAEWHRWNERHRQAVEELGDAGQQLAAAVRTTYEAARLRAVWRSAVEHMEPPELQQQAQTLVQRAEANGNDDFTRTWNALGPGDQEEIRQCAAGNSAIEFREALERHCQVASNGLETSEHGYGNPTPLRELQNMSKTPSWLARFAPALCARVGDAVIQLQHRVATMDAVTESLGITAIQPGERAQQVALLTPTQAASWFGTDPLFVFQSEPAEVQEEIQRRLTHFGAVVRRRIFAAKQRASAETLNRDVGEVTSEPELITLEWFHPDVAAVVHRARRRTEEQDADLVRELKQQIAKIRDTRDPETRSALQRSLETVLRSEQTRRSLTRRVWLSLARQGGLGPMEIGDHCRIEAARALAASTPVG